MRATSKELLEQLRAVKEQIPVKTAPSVSEVALNEGNRRGASVGEILPKARSAPNSNQTASTIEFAPELEDKLRHHEVQGSWSRQQLLSQLVEEMPHAFPEIVYQGEVLVESGVYRRVFRSADRLTLSIVTAQKTYSFDLLRKCDAYDYWFYYYRRKNVEIPGVPAAEMCIYLLEAFLTGFEDYQKEEWQKVIDSEQYVMRR